MSRRFAGLVIALLLLFGPFVASAESPPKGIPESAEQATVVSVSDGDTIHVQLADGTEEPLRLIGIDSPETEHPTKPDGCFGAESRDHLTTLLTPGRIVWLETDKSDRDRYDRLLRYVWAVKKDGKVFMVNEVEVRDGYAIAKRYSPDTHYAKRLEKAQAKARKKAAGMWKACDADQLLAAGMTEATPDANALAAGNCDASYPDVCIPSGPPDLNCGDVPFRDFVVLPPDPHQFDGNHDGIACEGP